MKVISYLDALDPDRLYGVAASTRNWNTITAIGRWGRAVPDRASGRARMTIELGARALLPAYFN